MGEYDLPAAIEYITDKTGPNNKLIYIGHSMGTTMFYVMALKRPDCAVHIGAMMSLAPIAYLSHTKSPVKIVAPFAHNIEVIVVDRNYSYYFIILYKKSTKVLCANFLVKVPILSQLIARFIGANEFLPQNVFLKFLARYGCEIDTLEETICANVVFVICGFDKNQFNYVSALIKVYYRSI